MATLLTILVTLVFTAFAVALPLATIAVAAVSIAGRLAERQRWTEEAAALGLRPVGRRHQGRVDDRAVAVWTEHRGRRSRATWWAARIALPELPAGLSVTRVGRLRPGAADDVLGDPVFDAEFAVTVDDVSRGLLDAATRAALRSEPHAELRDGHLLLERRGPWTARELRAHVALARRLAETDPEEALRAVAAADPARRVRVGALEALARSWPGDATRLLVTDLARSAAEPVVRAAATVLLGRTDELARLLRPLPAPELHALLGLIARRGTPAQVGCALSVLEPGTPRPLWHAATAAARAHPTPELRAALVARAGVLAVGDDAGFVADRAIGVLLDADAPDVEGHLTALLPRADRSLGEVLAWLGAHGTVAAVPALDALLAAAWPLTDARRAAEGAKAAIQARAGGHRGDLSLTTPDVRGALSTAADAAGTLAVPRRAAE